jgi:hypothetical protein
MLDFSVFLWGKLKNADTVYPCWSRNRNRHCATTRAHLSSKASKCGPTRGLFFNKTNLVMWAHMYICAHDTTEIVTPYHMGPPVSEASDSWGMCQYHPDFLEGKRILSCRPTCQCLSVLVMTLETSPFYAWSYVSAPTSRGPRCQSCWYFVRGKCWHVGPHVSVNQCWWRYIKCQWNRVLVGQHVSISKSFDWEKKEC